MLGLARGGAAEGAWLFADTQSGGRGRQGRAWVSPPGNLYSSGLVRLRAGDPSAASLALVAGIAVWDVVSAYIHSVRHPSESGDSSVNAGNAHSEMDTCFRGNDDFRDRLHLKWPNDLLCDGAKLAGILLEREGDAVVIGVGLNLAHHPDLPDRPATSIATLGIVPHTPAEATSALSANTARWLDKWRTQGLPAIIAAWLERAHPIGTALSVDNGNGTRLCGTFAGLDNTGALILALADGTQSVIHAGDVFLV